MGERETPGPDLPRRWPRRAAKILVWTVCLAVAIPLVVAAALVGVLNTGFGQRFAAREASALTDGAVAIRGLSGSLPWNIRVAHMVLSDSSGAYATIDALHLGWAPLALLSHTLRIETLSASAIDLARLPSSGKSPDETAAPAALRLPVRVVLGRLTVGRLTIGAPVAGVAAVLSVKGHADLASLSRGTANIAIQRLDAPGTYSATATMTPQAVQATARVDEANKGMIADAAHLPNLGGPLRFNLSLAGPRNAEALRLTLAAGPFTAHASGTIDLPGRKAALDLAADAPAMAPAPGLSWKSVAIAAHVAGPWTRPEASGTVAIAALEADGAAIGQLKAAINGNRGRVAIDATAIGVTIPGPEPGLLAASPLHLTASALLDTRERPVTFTLDHALIAAKGVVDLAPSLHGTMHVALPDLAPLAAALGEQAAGSAALDIAFARDGAAMAASLSGPIAITGGMPQLVSLIGRNGHLALDATMQGAESGRHITLRSLHVAGAALTLDAHGTDAAGTLDLAYRLDLPDLAAASSALRGTLTLQGTAKGLLNDLAAQVTATGQIGTASVPTVPIHLTVDASGLPSQPHATVNLRSMLEGAPLTLSADATRSIGGTHVVVHALDWKSLRGAADLTLPTGAAFPIGSLNLTMPHLADLAPLIHQPVEGSISARIATATMAGTPRVTLAIAAKNAGTPSARIDSATLDGTITDPTANPSLDLRLVARGIRAAGFAGEVSASVAGPETALAIRADAALGNLAGGPVRLTTSATLDVPRSRLALSALTANWKTLNLRLLAPARLAYAHGVSVEQLRLGVDHATLDLAGRITPALDLKLHLANLTPELVKPFAPALKAAGMADVSAHLTGTASAPRGSVRIAASGLRLLSGDARAMPAAALSATLGLAGGRTRVNAQLTAGHDLALTVIGTAPLAMRGKLDLSARGHVNLAVANPILEASGRHAAGNMAVDLAIRGPISRPETSGTIRLAGGEFQDYAQGVRLTGITAQIAAQGQTLRIENFLAHAGPGTIRLSGIVGALAPGIPVDLALRMENAQPLASDLLTANLDADIALRGEATRRVDASGTITVRHATINIPSSFPSAVASLHVIRPGQKPQPPPGSGLLVGLNLKVHAQPAIFVRGRGVFARFGGDLRVRGTTAAPRISNGFQMQNGNLSLAGANLNFTEGRIGFDGASVTNKLDPTLHFVAQSSSGGITATLTLGGTASQPTIKLSSAPSLPPDEILAHLLYGVSIAQLSPLQIASIARAIYSLTSGGSGAGPLGNVQSALGLDRLKLGSTNGTASGASLQAGKYVAPGVYIGATHTLSGATRAQVQIDLTKRLKLKTEVGTGGGTVTGATPRSGAGNSIGLSYQFEY